VDLRVHLDQGARDSRRATTKGLLRPPRLGGSVPGRHGCTSARLYAARGTDLSFAASMATTLTVIALAKQ
jgi:hypothetical protein